MAKRCQVTALQSTYATFHERVKKVDRARGDFLELVLSALLIRVAGSLYATRMFTFKAA